MTANLEAIAKTDDWSKVYDWAETFKKQEQWQPAAQAFQRAIELNADFFWSWHNLGDVLSKLQQWQPAAQAYNNAVKLDPSFFWSWHNLGDVLTKLQQWQPAAQAYSNAVKLDSSFFWSWHNSGDVLTKLQQWDLAIANYLQAIYLQPEHQFIYQKLGSAFKQRAALAKSIQDYRQLIQSPPQNSAFELFQAQPQRLIALASSLVEHHQIPAAIVVYYMVLEIQPIATDVTVHLAQLLRQQSQLEQAIALNQRKTQGRSSKLIVNSSRNYSPGTISVQANSREDSYPK